MFETKNKEEELYISLDRDLVFEIFEGIINDHLPIKIRKPKIAEIKITSDKYGRSFYIARVIGIPENPLNLDWSFGSFGRPDYSFKSREKLLPPEAFKRSRTIKKILSNEVEEVKDENKVRRVPKKKNI